MSPGLIEDIARVYSKNLSVSAVREIISIYYEKYVKHSNMARCKASGGEYVPNCALKSVVLFFPNKYMFVRIHYKYLESQYRCFADKNCAERRFWKERCQKNN